MTSKYDLLVSTIAEFSKVSVEKGDFTYISGWTQWWYSPEEDEFMAMKNKQVPKRKSFNIYFADTFNGHICTQNNLKERLK